MFCLVGCWRSIQLPTFLERKKNRCSSSSCSFTTLTNAHLTKSEAILSIAFHIGLYGNGFHSCGMASSNSRHFCMSARSYGGMGGMTSSNHTHSHPLVELLFASNFHQSIPSEHCIPSYLYEGMGGIPGMT